MIGVNSFTHSLVLRLRFCVSETPDNIHKILQVLKMHKTELPQPFPGKNAPRCKIYGNFHMYES